MKDVQSHPAILTERLLTLGTDPLTRAHATRTTGAQAIAAVNLACRAPGMPVLFLVPVRLRIHEEVFTLGIDFSDNDRLETPSGHHLDICLTTISRLHSSESYPVPAQVDKALGRRLYRSHDAEEEFKRLVIDGLDDFLKQHLEMNRLNHDSSKTEALPFLQVCVVRCLLNDVHHFLDISTCSNTIDSNQLLLFYAFSRLRRKGNGEQRRSRFSCLVVVPFYFVVIEIAMIYAFQGNLLKW